MANDMLKTEGKGHWRTRAWREFCIHWLGPVIVGVACFVFSYYIEFLRWPTPGAFLRCTLGVTLVWLPVRLLYRQPLVGYVAIVRVTALLTAAIATALLFMADNVSPWSALWLAFPWIAIGLFVGLTPQRFKWGEKGRKSVR